MASNAFAGVGSVLKRGDGTSSESFTAIAEVSSISMGGISRSFLDVTSLDSTGGYREFIPSFRDAGEITVTLNFTQAVFIAWKTDLDTATSINYQIVLSDTGATTIDFAGFVTNLGMEVPLDDKVSIDVTLKIDGDISITS